MRSTVPWRMTSPPAARASERISSWKTLGRSSRACWSSTRPSTENSLLSLSATHTLPSFEHRLGVRALHDVPLVLLRCYSRGRGRALLGLQDVPLLPLGDFV